MRACRRGVWWTLGLMIVLALPACPAKGQLAAFDDTADVVLVEIPVEVTRNGQPVGGLTADAFNIADNGKDQKILAFEEVDLLPLPAGPDALRVRGAALPAALRPLVLLPHGDRQGLSKGMNADKRAQGRFLVLENTRGRGRP